MGLSTFEVNKPKAAFEVADDLVEFGRFSVDWLLFGRKREGESNHVTISLSALNDCWCQSSMQHKRSPLVCGHYISSSQFTESETRAVKY